MEKKAQYSPARDVVVSVQVQYSMLMEDTPPNYACFPKETNEVIGGCLGMVGIRTGRGTHYRSIPTLRNPAHE